MANDTINDAVTMAGGAGALLAGRYRVVRQLGQGGMGSVWLAEDTQLDNRPFAIKMLPSILVSNRRAYRQLKDEALVAMKLTHTNIVTLRAFEENHGNPFLVMDYIDGQTLDEYLAEKCKVESVKCEVGGGISADEVLHILRPIAAALDYAHGEGVVHRDVKPANVMIRRDGHPFILDFGIAREIQETLTRVTGKLSSGTLLYMSPEQLTGEQPRPAQDVYSFAAMAYECLKGEPPFVRGAIEDQIKNKPPPPLTGKAAILAAGVMAGLAKKPEDRPPSCTAVLEGKGFSRVEHAERVDGGPRSVAALKCLLAAALVAALAGGAWWWLGGRDGTAGTNGTDVTAKAPVSGVSSVPDVPLPATNAPVAKPVPVAKPAATNAPVARPARQPTWEETQQAVNQAIRHVFYIRDRVEKTIEQKVKPYRAHPRHFGEIISEIDRRHEALKKLKDPATIEQARKFTADAENAADEIENKCLEKLGNRLRFCVSEEVKSARDFFEKSEKGAGVFWSEAIAAADRALALEPSNAEAKRLKVEAEGHLVPTADIAVVVDGRPLGAGEKVKIGGTTWTTPIRWGTGNIEAGKTYGGKVSYERGGRRHFGALENFTVDWRGARPFTVTLKEYTGPKAGDVKTLTLPGDVEMEMIYVAPGSFMMGSSSGDKDETPHQVRITKPYWIGKYPVTQAQWKALVMANGVSFEKGEPTPYFSREGKGSDRVSGMNTSDFPMEGISWDDCDALVKALNRNATDGRTYSLPTEAQWEFAAKGGKESRGYTYSGGNNMDALGWYYENSGVRTLSDSDWKPENVFSNKCRTHSVREKDVGNELGIVGMSGNVWEWCLDWYDKDYYAKSPTDDPCNTASGDGRVLRGGGWGDFARYCRSANRGRNDPGFRSYNFGFRLCCSAGPREGGAEP